jgi:hypothetical protein
VESLLTLAEIRAVCFTLTHPVISVSVNESAEHVSSTLACFNFQVLSQENNSLKKNGFKKEEELK